MRPKQSDVPPSTHDYNPYDSDSDDETVRDGSGPDWDSNDEFDDDEWNSQAPKEMFDTFTGAPANENLEDSNDTLDTDSEDEASVSEDYDVISIAPSQDGYSEIDIDDATFQYDPLLGDSIRVLSIEPAAKPGAPIVCAMKTRAPTSAHYLALSYTWGPIHEDRSHLTHEITCDDRQLHVSSNLHAALVAIRSHLDAGKWCMHGMRSSVWVDALCIDQFSIAERNQHVRTMDVIYREAARVLVWLGDLSEEKSKALTESTAIMPPVFQQWWLTERYQGQAFSKDDMSALSDRSWFKRRWVVQEFALQRNRTIMLGSAAVDFAQFWSLVHLYGLAKKFPLFEEYYSFDHTDEPRTLIANLHKYEKLECSLSHDIVFSLLGICKDSHMIAGARGLDYSESIDDIYLRLATKYLESVPTLIFASACLRPHSSFKGSRSNDWPSWVPDWRIQSIGSPQVTDGTESSLWETQNPGTWSIGSYVADAAKVGRLGRNTCGELRLWNLYDRKLSKNTLLRNFSVVHTTEKCLELYGWIAHRPGSATNVVDLDWQRKPLPPGVKLTSIDDSYDSDANGLYLRYTKRHRNQSTGPWETPQLYANDWPSVDDGDVLCVLFDYALCLVVRPASAYRFRLVNCFGRAKIEKHYFVWTQKSTPEIAWAYGDFTKPPKKFFIV